MKHYITLTDEEFKRICDKYGFKKMSQVKAKIIEKLLKIWLETNYETRHRQRTERTL